MCRMDEIEKIKKKLDFCLFSAKSIALWLKFIYAYCKVLYFCYAVSLIIGMHYGILVSTLRMARTESPKNRAFDTNLLFITQPKNSRLFFYLDFSNSSIRPPFVSIESKCNLKICFEALISQSPCELVHKQ